VTIAKCRVDANGDLREHRIKRHAARRAQQDESPAPESPDETLSDGHSRRDDGDLANTGTCGDGTNDGARRRSANESPDHFFDRRSFLVPAELHRPD
jgi:hypothetical protein